MFRLLIPTKKGIFLLIKTVIFTELTSFTEEVIQVIKIFREFKINKL